MKKNILIIAFLAIYSMSFSQQLSLYSQYMFNKFLINPAVTGSNNYVPIRLTARQQWAGIENAPSTQALSAHTLLGNKKMGVGGFVYADRFGPETKVGIQASYSYILPISGGKSQLAFGVAFRAFQYQLDYTQMTAIDDADPVLSGAKETSFVPDADFGIYWYSEKYFVGLSANQLIELPVEIADQTIDKNSMIRHYYLIGGYTFALSDNFELEPSILLKGTERTPGQIDINVRGILKRNYWLGFSYRTSKDIIAMIGLKVDKYIIGFAYDYTTSDINSYQSGSFEIMLGYNLGEGKNKGSSLL